MTAISRSDRDHQRRMLDHQKKSEAAAAVPQAATDPQLKIPLIGEVRRPATAPPAKLPRPNRKRPTDKQPVQAKLMP